MLHRRCIDDIIGAALCPEKELQCFIDHATNFNPSMKCTYGSSTNTVTFLDLQLTIDNNHIKSCVHFKPTDSHNYLLFSSSNPPSCQHSIPFSQMLQIKHCCTDDDDVITISNQVANHFSARQYPCISLSQPAKVLTQFTERIFLSHLLKRFLWIAFL